MDGMASRPKSELQLPQSSLTFGFYGNYETNYGLIGVLLLQVPIYTADMKAEKNPVLRISVLISGKVLLDGMERSLSEIQKVLDKAKSDKAAIWYYRESSSGEPPHKLWRYSSS